MSARPRHEYSLYLDDTDPRYPIIGESWTDDDNDDGHIDRAAVLTDVKFTSKEHMLRITGGTHFGFSGIVVLVYLDGELLDHNGIPLSDQERDYYELAAGNDEEEDY